MTQTSIDDALRQGAMRIGRFEARLLLAHQLQRPVEWLIAHGDDPLDESSRGGFDRLVERRALGEPIAHLRASREFFGRQFIVTPDVLIPRPETERLVELVMERLDAPQPRPANRARPVWTTAPAGPRSCAADCLTGDAGTTEAVLELGVGSGAIAVTLACERHDLVIDAVDISAPALEVAAANARAMGVERRVRLHHADWSAWRPPDDRRYSLVVSNPPYIAGNDPHLNQGDLRFEPVVALTPGPAGDEALSAIARLCGSGGHLLQVGGWIALEHGHDQGPRCRQLLAAQGFDSCATHRDTAGHDRITTATLGRTGHEGHEP